MLTYYCIIATIIFIFVLGVHFFVLKNKAQENKTDYKHSSEEFLTLEAVSTVIISLVIAAGWPVTIPLTITTLFTKFVMGKIIEKYEVEDDDDDNEEEEKEES